MQTAIRLLFACAAACALAACGVTNPSDLASVTFSGSVAPGSQSAQFAFKQNKTGEFIAKLTSVTPDSGVTLLLEYGAPVTGGCNVEGSFSIQQNHSVDTELPAGDYCMFLADPGFPQVPTTESFTIVVQHT